MNKIIVILILAGGLLAGCAADPKREAEANQTITQTASDAALAAQALAERKAAADLAQRQAEAMAQTWVMVKTWLTIATMASLSISAFGMILGVGGATIWTAYGIADAVRVAAMIRASQIPVDQLTGMLPALKNGNWLTNPETGANMRLDQPSEANDLQVRTLSLARLMSIAANNARRSKGEGNAEAVAAVNVDNLIVTQEMVPKTGGGRRATTRSKSNTR